ncbi:hypothetical protein PUNSTDRAFT_114870 [Punctularia strigosozonata HHB-11173 SS5]|uniref:uncharacterized protein n=1 Tax=Punctularia strigosozonata (strain HHB-11173) TaxID=741275 RepID=UPI00044173DE|nr:uncharacterized protein PUNSTDRAFT_114870 [Punctularia strigosozonata HHB-11173 SS5]EIN07428.1 hypothetical protein PUNSTDRAFT_114870 [Punctularia strigosozonata HHB-11173 SS5]
MSTVWKAGTKAAQAAPLSKAARLHIQLRDLPRSALPSDIRRVINKAKVENVADVTLDYKKFVPTGRAYLTMTHPDFTESNIRKLHGLTLTSIPVTVFTCDPPPGDARPSRSRGVQGRAEAEERGVITGNGPNGGITGRGKTVALWGLPWKITSEQVKLNLKGFQFAASGDEVYKLDKAGIENHSQSRHIVRLASASEAHRLVRRLHLTYWSKEMYGTKFLVRARVIY